MARLNLLQLCVLGLCLAVASAQFGGKRPPKPKAPVAKGDIKYIKCQVCEAIAKQSIKATKDLIEQAGPKKVPEADILERVEKMCDPDTDDGEWITKYDIVEEDSALVLKDTGAVGRCKSECRTIARACEMISDDVDLTDLSAMLFKGKKRAAISNWMCHDASDACSKKAPALTKREGADEAHAPMDEDELRTERMMRSMKAAGLSGTMYNKETMQEELAEMADQYEDNEDFARMLEETGLDKHMPSRPGSDAQEPDSGVGGGAAAGAVADAAARLQDTLTQVKEGASKLFDSAKGLVGKWFGKKEAAKKPAGEL
ncbi:hypothetical protein CHLRE_03g151700v5 [Chlamydomonas reinhardtii]|uniref:Saposin B-type domain-containing protein n=1 Tax=Chlamydomonas reinhardtii TaxID=3055 RepID=A8J2L8_CHLRE|nr:uncharacterized protein CHLRE_03g151700v5 [Chlamydomonas reinhardtii]PNW84622.1 hypothetical protein CHLRE_03g151700v5 [Chlamydomonas reinhardtii]|eukprot:XP_001695660.1 predicted protein [Chlamydomonas reinhardtii]